MKPIVAIVGRPNVGKSTLFNRLAQRPLAIVFDAPGITRDRHYADAHMHGRDVVLVDTGGFDPESEDPMGMGIANHVRAAIAEADVVVTVLDGSAPPTEADRQAIQLLRNSKKPVIYVGNKVDRPIGDAVMMELYELGVRQILAVSALHGRGMAELMAAVVAELPPFVPASEAIEVGGPRVAFLGRPNAGKSSLLNHLAGTERSLVDDRPGTTRDPVDCAVTYQGKPYLVVDTAGIRRRARVDEGVESASVIRSIRAMERAEVAVLVCDSSAEVAEQDARLLGLCLDRGRALVVALNKVDLIDKKTRKKVEAQARDALRFAPWAPVVHISAKTGAGVPELMALVAKAAAEFTLRVPTAALNRFFDKVLATRQPPTSGGKAPRIYYLTQAQTAPPVFVAMTSAPESVPESYRRFVSNQIRQEFGFDAVPVIIRWRARRRAER
ncbi:MAG: ribosome biogenesis GTPase Der [Polyangiaceae bacterium]|nr:ribosome biogenesis GTPase Der [Polyangiaceae bacterium]